MSVPRSRRAKILTNLIKQLETIKTENGYTTDVREVSMNVKNWETKLEPETPVIYVVDIRTLPKYNAGKLMEWEWTVALIGFMRNRTQMEMEEFMSDILTCLQENQTLAFEDTGRTVAHHRIVEMNTDGQFFNEIEGSQLFRIDMTLLYTACVDDYR